MNANIMRNNKSVMKIQKSPEISYLLGVYYSDGCISHYRGQCARLHRKKNSMNTEIFELRINKQKSIQRFLTLIRPCIKMNPRNYVNTERRVLSTKTKRACRDYALLTPPPKG